MQMQSNSEGPISPTIAHHLGWCHIMTLVKSNTILPKFCCFWFKKTFEASICRSQISGHRRADVVAAFSASGLCGVWGEKCQGDSSSKKV